MLGLGLPCSWLGQWDRPRCQALPREPQGAPTAPGPGPREPLALPAPSLHTYTHKYFHRQIRGFTCTPLPLAYLTGVMPIQRADGFSGTTIDRAGTGESHPFPWLGYGGTHPLLFPFALVFRKMRTSSYNLTFVTSPKKQQWCLRTEARRDLSQTPL